MGLVRLDFGVLLGWEDQNWSGRLDLNWEGWGGSGQVEGGLTDLLLDWSSASWMVMMAPPLEVLTSFVPAGGADTLLMC